jgi:hypothetical protein
MGYAYSSPIKGWLAVVLIPIFGLTNAWNLLVIAARAATVLCAYGAARAWALPPRGALAAAAVFGCSPFFHGYAVEGIAEGTDGWTLALWLWALGRRRFRLAAIPFALTIVSSWYLGMVACLLAAMALLKDRRVAWSALGFVLAAPALVQFFSAFSGGEPLNATIRAAMGAHLVIPNPGIGPGTNPFAMNAYVGFTVMAAALASRTRWVLAAAIPAFLSLGIGPIYDLPIAEMVRFPYRWHAATLVLLAPAVGIAASRFRWGGWLGALIVIEGLVASPVEPWLPGADANIPAYVAHIDGPVLELPGPLAMAPGRINRSRHRAQYLMFYQTAHRQPSPWVPDFNSVGVRDTEHADVIATFTALDKLSGLPLPENLPLKGLAAMGVEYVVLHHRELGHSRRTLVESEMKAAGWTSLFDDSGASVWMDGN